MKHAIIYFSILFLAGLILSLSSHAKVEKRYLVPCVDGSGACNIGTNQTPKDMLCEVPDDSNDYDIEIKKRELGLLDKAKEMVGLKASLTRAWTSGDSIEVDEEIECVLNLTKKGQRLDAIAEREIQEKAKKDKQTLDWQTACGRAKGDVELLICQERGF
jgi:hypothetical protein